MKRPAWTYNLRPWWQIVLLLPGYPLYLAARAFADWMEDHV